MGSVIRSRKFWVIGSILNTSNPDTMPNSTQCFMMNFNIISIGSIWFKGKDSEGIDVPLFDWGSILAATNKFSDTHMLGKGGFGAVYEVIDLIA